MPSRRLRPELAPTALTLSLVATACSPVVSFTRTGRGAPSWPRSVDRVAIFTQPINCRSHEVGMVEASSRASTPRETLEAMREEAAKRGADAIDLSGHQDIAHHGAGHIYTATAIAFDEPCWSASTSVPAGR